MLLASLNNTPNLKSLPPFGRREGGVGGEGIKKLWNVLLFSFFQVQTIIHNTGFQLFILT